MLGNAEDLVGCGFTTGLVVVGFSPAAPLSLSLAVWLGPQLRIFRKVLCGYTVRWDKNKVDRCFDLNE